MFFRGSLISFLVLCLAAMAIGGYFKFEDCSKEGAIAEATTFRISPDPVNLKENMTVDMMVKILRDIPPEAVLKTRYYKLKSLFGVTIDVPILCLLGKFGSCTLPLCEYLKMYRDQVEPTFPTDRRYGCPVMAGDYGGDNMETEMPDMSLVARIIVRGRYRTELKLLDRTFGKELACYKIWTEIK